MTKNVVKVMTAYREENRVENKRVVSHGIGNKRREGNMISYGIQY